MATSAEYRKVARATKYSSEVVAAPITPVLQAVLNAAAERYPYAIEVAELVTRTLKAKGLVETFNYNPATGTIMVRFVCQSK